MSIKNWPHHRFGIIVLVILLLDCYADDFLDFIGLKTVNLIDFPVTQAAAYLVIWSGLIVLYVICCVFLWRRLDRKGLDGYFGWFLLFTGTTLIGINHIIRIQLAVINPAISMQNVPPFFFIQSYAERLAIYFLLFITTLVGSVMVCTRPIKWTRRFPMISLFVTSGLIFLAILMPGIDTLASSPYWEGKSIVHGQVYMGSIPRDLAHVFEPYATIIIILSLGSITAVLNLSGAPSPVNRCLLLVILLACFIQIIPKIGSHTFTEAVSATDFYYTFHHDRSISFSSLPFLVFFLIALIIRLSEGNRERTHSLADRDV